MAKLGIVTLASPFGLLGCSDYVIEIPCLGPALAPSPVPGMTYLRASQIGCALDCDLGTGKNKYRGGAATDDASVINKAMAGASEKNPITLIIDGSALISGLFLPAGGYWSIAGLGCGTGFYVKSGTNNDGIHNGPAVWLVDNTGPPAPSRGSNISLSNFTINGNAGNGKSGVSSTGFPQGNLSTGQECYPINLMNLNHIKIENVVIVDSPCYHIRLSNVGDAVVSGCVLRSHGPNTDGVHVDGPANDITISGCNFTTNDDAIALNCPEGYSGDIARVTVNNCQFNSPRFMRLDTISYPGVFQTFYIDDVNVTGCTGTSIHPCFEIGDGTGSRPESVRSLAISDCTVNAPAVLNAWANFGTVALRNVRLIPTEGSQEAPGFSLVRTDLKLLNPDSGFYEGSRLVIENCVIERHSDAPVFVLVLLNKSTIKRIEINGFTLEDSGGHSTVPEMLKILSGNIGELVLNSVVSTRIKSPVSEGGFASINLVSGAGTLASGWEFPDAVMADDVAYISANTGLPSIKIGGVVEPYP
jgi:hypothetical protein